MCGFDGIQTAWVKWKGTVYTFGVKMMGYFRCNVLSHQIIIKKRPLFGITNILKIHMGRISSKRLRCIVKCLRENNINWQEFSSFINCSCIKHVSLILH